jgi:bifunctional lysine-specific demethylase and histidyl-hydroxylase NO66
LDPDRTALADLVGDVDLFASDHWGRRPLHRRARCDLSGLLSVDEIERMLLSSIRRPSFRLVQDGTTLPSERSTGTVHFGGRRVEDVADFTKITTALDAGATLVLQGLQRTSLDMARYCGQLERATSHPVQANAYLTPAGASGLGPHRDDHDVLVVQVDGHKTWDIEELGVVTLEAGDVLYLPAATTHSAAAQDQPSLHLTFGILRITHAHVLRRALAQQEAIDLTRALPLGFARPERTGELVADLHQMLDGLADQLSGLDITAVAEAEQSRARSRRRALAAGQLRSILSVRDVDSDTRVSRRLDLDASMHEALDGDRIVLALPDRRLLLPAAMRAAVDLLLGGRPVAVGALPDLDPGSRVVLARRLIREGFLVVHDAHHV